MQLAPLDRKEDEQRKMLSGTEPDVLAPRAAEFRGAEATQEIGR